MMLKRMGLPEDHRAMTTLCRAHSSEADARAAVARLLSAGVPGADVRVLTGEPVRDGRDEPVGGFAGAGGDSVGTFAGDAAGHRDGMGGFAGDADRMRAGGFADADREAVTSYPAGVAKVRVAAHRGLKRMLLDAGLDEATADADVRALHEGRILVLVATGAVGAAEVERALDAMPV
ncbi:MAG: hypothetical protein QOH72_5264 [Solirubrobacteraceae bacterium]|nr:hypothetical protein [Solirubrobacteraceae bacterium]